MGDRGVRTIIVNAGGLESVVQVIKYHPFDEQVQTNGVFAIGTLAEGHDENRAKIVGLGGLQLIKVAMAQFPLNEDMQSHATWAEEMLNTKPGWFG